MLKYEILDSRAKAAIFYLYLNENFLICRKNTAVDIIYLKHHLAKLGFETLYMRGKIL